MLHIYRFANDHYPIMLKKSILISYERLSCLVGCTSDFDWSRY